MAHSVGCYPLRSHELAEEAPADASDVKIHGRHRRHGNWGAQTYPTSGDQYRDVQIAKTTGASGNLDLADLTRGPVLRRACYERVRPGPGCVRQAKGRPIGTNLMHSVPLESNQFSTKMIGAQRFFSAGLSARSSAVDEAQYAKAQYYALAGSPASRAG